MERVTSTDPGPLPDPRALRPRLPSPVQEIEDAPFARRGVRLLLKRDDLIHPELPGNKWRKLAPNLRAAAAAGERALLTFGGAYSNHLRATAAAGRLLGFATIGVVRGDELADAPRNPSLARCAADGMRLHFIDRARYRRRSDPEVLAELRDRFGAFRLIPEGGSNALAAQGCTELGRELRGAADTVAVACGTGGTLAGLAAGLGPGQRALGFPVLKGGRPHFLQEAVEELQRAAFGGPRGDWRLEDRFHCGGYARRTPELDTFATAFEDRHGLPLERIYVAKLLLGLTTLAEEGSFAPGSTVAAVITGTP
ncbi:pyridoxal-phosphate dependent enzyme [Streptomyces sp. RPA4-5]|uniref:1-aminocyclopropane-1-carboxylate deaminase/D-cysteine desulfhydrase n=1 Tax=Streptomyces TaxID=1883 RepID=UPI00143ED3BA|nr:MULTISPECIES: pyridoxal-phosphate dependent enzyme [Streptomyces]MCX4636274.1 pyridoxal-phosphate dependent enzyme [Streptomyces platensis]QIY57515.1 pyridoxal-phosphate dependent enzyme [Streptomyces sp. RPA4-5]WJY43007.1 pyridoxal-phosphate dependent enzyme [Streptomyces sp. P9-2B-2]